MLRGVIQEAPFLELGDKEHRFWSGSSVGAGSPPAAPSMAAAVAVAVSPVVQVDRRFDFDPVIPRLR